MDTHSNGKLEKKEKFWTIKNRPDGSCIIHQSKMYSREEVKNKMLLFGIKIMVEAKNNTIGSFDQDKFIEENL